MPGLPGTSLFLVLSALGGAGAVDAFAIEAEVRSDTQTIAVGQSHTCAITANGGAFCWGRGSWGQLGNRANTVSIGSPVAVAVPAGEQFVAVSSFSEHSCALTGAGDVYCWGEGRSGKLGHGQDRDQNAPVKVSAPEGTKFVSVAAGVFHTCGVTTTGGAYCWGGGANGQLGNGDTAQAATPVPVKVPAGVKLVSISAGDRHTCAVARSGAAYCWGSGSDGRLGNGATASQTTPVMVTAPAGVKFVAIGAGTYFTCGLAATGEAYCWGKNEFGELGTGTAGGDASTPQRVAAPEGTQFVAIDVGGNHACGITAAGAAYCWGRNGDGQLGDGSTSHKAAPVSVGFVSHVQFKAISAGMYHTCATAANGTAYCWGRGTDGQLGDSNKRSRQNALPVSAFGMKFAVPPHRE